MPSSLVVIEVLFRWFYLELLLLVTAYRLPCDYDYVFDRGRTLAALMPYSAGCMAAVAEAVVVA